MAVRRAGLLILLLATACGSSSSVSGGAGAGGDAGVEASAGGDAGVEASAGGDAGVEASAGGSGGSAGLDAGGSDGHSSPDRWDSGPIDAGVFDCMGACCDGTTHYCRVVSGGAAPVFGTPPEAGPATCSDAGTSKWCVPLPAACAGAPSCACVGTEPQNQGPCQCGDTGGGITVSCTYP